MATCARSHGGDGGDRPPRGRPTRIPRGCESSLPKKVRGQR
ncbi:hypothetical protein M8C21_010844 [Ambrosia artemisiifolia]|uniref:Uncharacterized protein n=1 Tax=Ambrosia artemisiifolia TaxID=4212 RepID=A0AAD5CKR1_AMBAR|nr:hypothetical protein M8C21_010844 [Ambrosia artemisiifolia]